MGALIKRRSVLAAKAEGTVGTAEALTATEAAFNVYNLDIKPNIEMVTRDGQSAFSPLPAIAGGELIDFEFDVDLVGDAADDAPSWATTFLPACGMAVSTSTWKPDSGAAGTITLGGYKDGRFYSAAGAMGDITINLASAAHGMVHFKFTGVYQAISDVALLTPTYPTTKPPRVSGSTITLASYVPKFSNMSIAFGNVLKVREDRTKASGYHSTKIVNRDVKITLDPESELVATYNPYALMLASTEQALSVAIGATTHNIITIAAPKTQIVNVQPGDRGGLDIDSLTMQCNRSAAAGDDEISITFS